MSDRNRSRAWAYLTTEEEQALEARATAEGLARSDIMLRALRLYLTTPLLGAGVAELGAMVPGAFDQQAAIDATGAIPMAASVLSAAHVEQLASTAATLERVARAMNQALPSVVVLTGEREELRQNLEVLADGVGTIAADVAHRYGLPAAAPDGEPG